MSRETSERLTSSELIKYAYQSEIKMVDPLALEDAPDDLDEAET